MKSVKAKEDTVSLSSELEQQKAYAGNLEKSGCSFDLIIGDAFIRGMRDIGYRHTGTALDELIDNSIEAGAQNIVIGFKTAKDGKKPDALCVIDDGHGMPTDKPMLRAAVMWGGTHRENSRKGIGRYGYGLPSASVSQCRRFTVFSKTKEDKEWYAVTIDMDEIAAGEYSKNGRILIPEPEAAKLPSWIVNSFGKALNHGTVVVWEKLDRLTWTTLNGLTSNLVEHFGITYRNFLRNTKVVVGDTIVEPIDPLFATPGFMHYDYDDQKTQVMEPFRFEVKLQDGESKVPITVRSVVFPFGFGAKDKSKDAEGANLNPRGKIMREYNGLIISRMGRQIDIATNTPTDWPIKINTNNDRYWAMEIDFPADLDEEFNVTTSRQKVELSNRIWDLLKQAGVVRMIQSYKKMIEEDQRRRKAERDQAKDPDQARPSEQVMSEGDKFVHAIPGQTSEERERLSREAFEREVKRRQTQEKKTEEQARSELQKEVQNKHHKVKFDEVPGGPFYRVEQVGPQIVIYINQKHAFFSGLYASKDSNPRIRAALEVFLFVLGKAELDAAGNQERKMFYTTERQAWSRNLDVFLELLDTVSGFSNQEELDEVAAE